MMGQAFLALFAEISTSMLVMLLCLSAVGSYLLGCLNGAVIVSKYILKDDIRNHGSGNAGLTNFHRTFGGKLIFLVLGLDVAKMLIAVWFSLIAFSMVLTDVPVFVRYWAGIFCTFGHMFPAMFQFRGGKGVLSGGALVCMLDWRIAVVGLAAFFVVSYLTRWISLGSCCAAIAFPIMSAYVYRSMPIFVIALIVGSLILWQHSANIKRILKGEESKITFKRKQV